MRQASHAAHGLAPWDSRMASTEIEFELSAQQFALMGYPQLSQGQTLTVQLETGVLDPTGRRKDGMLYARRACCRRSCG